MTWIWWWPRRRRPFRAGDGGVITSGQTKAGTINHFGDLDVYTFNVAAGNTFKVAVGDADSNSNYRARRLLFDPNGNQVGTGAAGFTASSETVTYSVPGTGSGMYTVVVAGLTAGIRWAAMTWIWWWPPRRRRRIPMGMGA